LKKLPKERSKELNMPGQDGLEKIHEPVLLGEVVDALRVKDLAHLKKAHFIDATLGLGGHSLEICKAGGNVLGIEADEESLEIARKRLMKVCPPTFSSHERGSFTLVHGNFRDLKEIALKERFDRVDGILFDLGISSYQLATKVKGFSFQDLDAYLDMRFDRISQEVTAQDLLKVLNVGQLIELFRVTMPKGVARALSKRIVEARKIREIKTVGDFLEIIKPKFRSKPKLNPSTLPFLALRIAVNSELDNLRQALPQALELLKAGGRLVVISFHSGEDGLVKNFFKESQDSERGLIITKKPIFPEKKEIATNPRARSAKMRILQKK